MAIELKFSVLVLFNILRSVGQETALNLWEIKMEIAGSLEKFKYISLNYFIAPN